MKQNIMKQNNMKWKLVLSAWDRRVLDKIVKEICNLSQQNLIKYSVVPLPNKKKLFTLLKSPHVYKSSRDQYYWESKRTLIYLSDCQLSIFDNLSIAHSVNLVVSALNNNQQISYRPKTHELIMSASKIIDPTI